MHVSVPRMSKRSIFRCYFPSVANISPPSIRARISPHPARLALEKPSPKAMSSLRSTFCARMSARRRPSVVPRSTHLRNTFLNVRYNSTHGPGPDSTQSSNRDALSTFKLPHGALFYNEDRKEQKRQLMKLEAELRTHYMRKHFESQKTKIVYDKGLSLFLTRFNPGYDETRYIVSRRPMYHLAVPILLLFTSMYLAVRVMILRSW